MATLDAMDIGDHACLVSADAGVGAAYTRAFVADGALFGDKVVVLGPPGARRLWPDVTSYDLGQAGGSLLGVVRREAREAGEQGFRTLRVLALMDRIWPGGATEQAIAEYETGMEAFTAATGAMVVCAYSRVHFSDGSLAQALSVHPHHAGTRNTVEPSFRIFQARTEHWHVTGVVDADGAQAFRSAVTVIAAACPVLRLHCEDLEFMDAAGMQALIQAAREHAGHRVHLLDVNDTVRRCWELLGYHRQDLPVELAP
ncbi:anti-anti-sigma factor [Streptomyces sp. DvalAA-14]|uniref:MEDS domain-containing protein n=1 Tax=unclassified Streptomyces TaxID=2593676 RepID=UPI00081B776F|nr:MULTISPECIES: MEDS domain-containing protein [unclassified Streptomyces]MYS20764.1 STAS domain-containing protein [Streptomyces sp. SID4948]SCD76725.1 anti-anti-sigma factor [Streptomyces sp. DvalAA-14]